MRTRHCPRAVFAIVSVLLLSLTPALAGPSTEPEGSAIQPAEASVAQPADAAVKPVEAADPAVTPEPGSRTIREMLVREAPETMAATALAPVTLAPARMHGGRRTVWIVVACIVGAAIIIAAADGGGGGGGGGGY